jgi:cysteine desulfurase
MAEALLLAQVELSERTRKLTEIRDYLIKNVLEKIPECHLTGHPSIRLPNHASFVFGGVDGNHLLMMLDMAGFSCSSGSACKSGSPKPSDILLAIGIPLNWALGSLRVTLGLDTTMEQIDSFLQVLPKLVEKAKK